MRGGMRNPMPEQPADVRNKNFKEVALGYVLMLKFRLLFRL